MGYRKQHPRTLAGSNLAARTDAFVCPDCFEDRVLRDFVRTNASAPTCDFCGASADENIAVSITEFAAHIDGCLRAGYAKAVEGVDCDSGESGWLLTGIRGSFLKKSALK
jgi:predicted RNA-binding Zn-ribbon protein involved in translation (DUF1610 family)